MSIIGLFRNGGNTMAEFEKFPWRALQFGEIAIQGESHSMVVVECGMLHLPSGRLVAADPFVTLELRNGYYAVSPGIYPVFATIDDTIKREMYFSLILSATPEVRRRYLTSYTADDQAYPEVIDEQFYGVPVDSGTVCFVDDEAVRRGMPIDPKQWYDAIFDNNRPDCWFQMMDNPDHIRAGIANVPLPLATDSTNLILCHSGWGDGFYPVVGGYDTEDVLVAVHIDLLIHAV
jgi:hypothetical protein